MNYVCASPGAPRIVLLQGPVGPFFRKLRCALDAAGFDCWQILLNAGDRLYAGISRKCLSFHKRAGRWEEWLREILVRCGFQQIILFGSERPAHRVARRVATALGIRIISLEEGYIRPGMIAVELGGNNRLSPIAGKLPPCAFEITRRELLHPYEGSFASMCFYGAIYYGAVCLLDGQQRKALLHRHIRISRELLSWSRNLYRRFFKQSLNVRLTENLLEHHVGCYFIVALQVAEDSQLGEAACGWNNARLIRDTLQSFAMSAPQHFRLVFKIHPLERGRNLDRAQIRQTSMELGITDRVDIIDVGSIGHLVRHSAGMITINSTSGLSAIYHGTPLLVIGEAFYAHDLLATCAQGQPDFAKFWIERRMASKSLRSRYIAWIKENCLRQGDFYTRKGIEASCKAIIETVRSPLPHGQGRNKAS